MIVLGLDPSLTNFGFSVYDTSKTKPEERVIVRGRLQSKASTVLYLRYWQMREALSELIDKFKPDKVGVESPVFGSTWSEGMFALFIYVIECLYLKKLDYVLFSPHQVKMIGRELAQRPSGWKMEKADMVDAAKKLTNIPKWNHNEADALVISYMASRFWEYQNNPTVQLTPLELNLFAASKVASKGKNKGEVVKDGIIHKKNDRYFLWSTEELDGYQEKIVQISTKQLIIPAVKVKGPSKKRGNRRSDSGSGSIKSEGI